MNSKGLIQCILAGIAWLSQGKSMAADVDVQSWEHIRESRPEFYEALMLSSFKELRMQHPKAVKVTRVAAVGGWGPNYACTLFEEKSEKSVMMEVVSYLPLETSDRMQPTLLRIKLTEEKDIQKAVLLMTQALGPVKWDNAFGKKPLGEDSNVLMFEKYEQDVGHYTINAYLPEPSRKALADLKKMAMRFSQFKQGK
ncbi:hypothetical protein [Prosthecobacter sp.]|uniref:hypothetical protein n=1 Tax=Prosthecobacter sp. TaxID=1965333 RepID=UPI0037844790